MYCNLHVQAFLRAELAAAQTELQTYRQKVRDLEEELSLKEAQWFEREENVRYEVSWCTLNTHTYSTR